jgi:hypothetical protein
VQEAPSVVRSSTQLGDIPLEREIRISAVAAAPEGARSQGASSRVSRSRPGRSGLPRSAGRTIRGPHRFARLSSRSISEDACDPARAKIWSSTAESSVMVTEHCVVSRDCRSGSRGDGYRVFWTSRLQHRCLLKSPDAEQNHYTSVPCLPKMRRDSRALAADLAGIAPGGPDWK